MRAVYVPHIDLSLEDAVELRDHQFHHLKNVLRIKIQEEILFLSGRGSARIYQVIEIDKKSIRCQPIGALVREPAGHGIELAVGKVKKDALDLILKQVCELGIKKVYLLETEYSQNYALKKSRIDSLLISGLEQSNCMTLPEVQEIRLNEIPFNEFPNVFYASLDTQATSFQPKEGKSLLLIGPEGGFSSSENELIEKLYQSHPVKFNTFIQRSPTAVACATGYILSKIEGLG